MSKAANILLISFDHTLYRVSLVSSSLIYALLRRRSVVEWSDTLVDVIILRIPAIRGQLQSPACNQFFFKFKFMLLVGKTE